MAGLDQPPNLFCLHYSVASAAGGGADEGAAASHSDAAAAIDFVHSENTVLDTRTKRAAQRFSPSVVSLRFSSTGGNEIYGSGTVVESGGCDERGCFAAVLTLAHFVLYSESSTDAIQVGKSIFLALEPNVRLPNGEIGLGSLRWLDLHYNMALVDVQREAVLTIAKLRPVDDSLEIFTNDGGSSHHSDQMLHKVYPGGFFTLCQTRDKSGGKGRHQIGHLAKMKNLEKESVAQVVNQFLTKLNAGNSGSNKPWVAQIKEGGLILSQ